MLLALIRVWDTNKRAIRVHSVVAALSKKELIDALAADRAARIGLLEVIEDVKDDFQKKIGVAPSRSTCSSSLSRVS